MPTVLIGMYFHPIIGGNLVTELEGIVGYPPEVAGVPLLIHGFIIHFTV